MSDKLPYVTKVFTGLPGEVEDAITTWVNDHTGDGQATDYGILVRPSGELFLWMQPSATLVGDKPHVVVVVLAQVAFL